jgi:glycyl-tRNA synthetase alpha chain
VQELYLESLKAIGIDLARHDIKFEEDNWEAPTLAAWGVGWQVMLDGLEITQFTYFQQCGGIDLDPMCAELTYGLERIAAFLQDVDSIYDIVWVHGPAGDVTYGDVRLPDEEQFSVYNFEKADVDKLWQHLAAYEAECQSLVDQYVVATTEPKKGKKDSQASATGSAALPAAAPVAPRFTEEERRRFPLLPAYDLCLKCSHLFNLLDARGAISVTERVGVIQRVRNLAVGVARAWVDQQSPRAVTPPVNPSVTVQAAQGS